MSERDRNVTDPELFVQPLNLSRPELWRIRARYLPLNALIVGSPLGDKSGVAEVLAGEGWRISSCEGPGRVRCPLLRGKSACPLRRTADVAVVYADARGLASGAAVLPQLRCAADPSSPGLIALEGRLDDPLIEGCRGVVGAFRSPQTIARMVGSVCGHDPEGPST